MDMAMQPPPLSMSQMPMQSQPPPGTTPPAKKRSSVACRECRRMRSKCIHEKGKPPCKSCALKNLNCVFPARGEADNNDRDYRHPRKRAEKAIKRELARARDASVDGHLMRAAAASALHQSVKAYDAWDYLPPTPEIIEAVDSFTTNYFQLSFIPKNRFKEQLLNDARSVSAFLLLGILSVSARLTGCLIDRHGGSLQAAEYYMEHASAVAMHELYKPAALATMQGFLLLSIAQQGSGEQWRSSINMGIATRMATTAALHREEAYRHVNASPDGVMRAEAARRTLWVLHGQDNLHSLPNSPSWLSSSDITALLPSSEEDFEAGREPASRAALEGTPPAMENPALTSDPGRSLFATSVQAHQLWGEISRRALTFEKREQPWEDGSEYGKMTKRLRDWEETLPRDHRWGSPTLLRGYKSEGTDLAYCSVTMITRLCNILVRKPYLPDIIQGSSSDSRASFWREMSDELFENVKRLDEQIRTVWENRRPGTGDGIGAQMAIFCVFTCGFLGVYLRKYPQLCDDRILASAADDMVDRADMILREYQGIWPLVLGWIKALREHNHHSHGPDTAEPNLRDGREPMPDLLSCASSFADGRTFHLRNPPSGTEDQAMLSQSPGELVQHGLPGVSSGTTTLSNIDPSLRRLPTPQPQRSSPAPVSAHESTAPQARNPSVFADREHEANQGLGLLVDAASQAIHNAGAAHDALGTMQELGPGATPASIDGYENHLYNFATGGTAAQGLNVVTGGGSLSCGNGYT